MGLRTNSGRLGRGGNSPLDPFSYNLACWTSSASWSWSTQNPFSITGGTIFPVTYGTKGYLIVTGGTGVYPGAYLVDGTASGFATGGADGTQNMLHTAQAPFTSAGATGGLGYWDSISVPTRNIVFDGNSLVNGSGASSARMAFPEQCYRQLQIPWNYAGNYGVGGQTTPEMTADAVPEIDPLIKAAHTNVCVPWEITNDLFYGSDHLTPASPSTALTNYKAYCSARISAGWQKVVAVTVLPRSGGDANFESYRATCNTELRNPANIGVYWHAVADVAADPNLGPAGSTSNTTYYADGTHLTDVGYAIVSSIVRNACYSLF